MFAIFVLKMPFRCFISGNGINHCFGILGSVGISALCSQCSQSPAGAETSSRRVPVLYLRERNETVASAFVVWRLLPASFIYLIGKLIGICTSGCQLLTVKLKNKARFSSSSKKALLLTVAVRAFCSRFVGGRACTQGVAAAPQ